MQRCMCRGSCTCHRSTFTENVVIYKTDMIVLTTAEELHAYRERARETHWLVILQKLADTNKLFLYFLYFFPKNTPFSNLQIFL